MKAQKFQTSFEFGEISPRLLARVDLPAYGKAAKTLENYYSLIHGGATKRRGLLFTGALKTESQLGRLIPFVFSTTRKFMLVLNGGKVQFLKEGAFVETSPGVRYELTMPYLSAELADVQYSQSGNTMYLVHPNYPPKLLQRITDTNWTLIDIPFEYKAVSDVSFSNAHITFKIVNGSDVFQKGEAFQITTSGGAVTSISGPTNTQNLKTSVVAATTEHIGLSTLLVIDGRTLVAGDRVLVKNLNNPELNGIWVASTGTWTRATDLDTAAECNAAYVKVLFGDLNAGTYWKQTANIVTINTTPQVWNTALPMGSGQIAGVASMPGSTGTETWNIVCTFSSSIRQEWSVVGTVSGNAIAYWKTGNYPQSVSFFEQRLFFGGSPQFPQHIWGSRIADYLNMTVGNTDADGVIVQIAGNDYSRINHMVGARNLMSLTASTEFSLSGPSAFSISGTTSNVVKAHTWHGSNNVRPLFIGREVIFLQRDGKKARAISYSVTEDANIAPDITIFAEHMTRYATMTDMAFAADPDYIAWIVRSDGQLLSLTLAREFETTAWARHTTDGRFESVGTVPGLSSNDVYFIVNRTVNGSTRRFVEQFDYTDTDVCYSDSAQIYSGPATAVITGLGHLEGKTVTALVGAGAAAVVHPDRVVTGGSITLEAPTTYATIGLPYTATLEMLNPEFGDASQSSQGRTISITDITVRFQDTVNCLVNGVVLPFRTNTMGLDTGILPFTGDMRIKAHCSWRSPQDIKITSETPTASTILGVIYDAAVN